MSNARDLELVKQARRGDGQAAGLLYDRHQEAIFRFVWSRVGHRQAAEDLTGEVFSRMVGSLPSFNDQGVPFRAWLYRIARNLLTDTFRQENRRATVPLEQMEHDPSRRAAAVHSSAPSLEMIAEMTLTLEKIRGALAAIDPRQREVVELRFLAGLSLQEVADALDESVAAVKSLQHRGLQALRAALPEEMMP